MGGIVSQGKNYDPQVGDIVNREEQRKIFIEVLDRICSGMPYSHNLFEWYGSPGIGKSILIALLRHECEQREIPSVLVDFFPFTPSARVAFFIDPIKLVDFMTASLIRYGDVNKLQEQITAYQKINLPTEGICLAYARLSENDRLYANVNWLQAMYSVMSAFVDFVETLTSADPKGHISPLVLFVDSLDDIPELLADWLEEFVVKPLVQTKRCIVVWTARHSWKWKRPEIRWDRKSEELCPFNEAEIKKLLQLSPRFKDEQDLAEQLFKNVYQMTGGHSYAGAVVVKQIGDWVDVNTQALKLHEIELRSKINEHVIQNHAFKDLTLEQRTALELCSMVRLIDTTTLQHILQECIGGKYNTWEWQKFDRLIYELRRTYLIKWGRSGWILEPSLRHLMRSYYLVCAPDIFARVNQAALKVYQEWLSKPVDNRKLFIIEELYHYLSLQQVHHKKEDIGKILDQRLDEYSSPVRQNPEAWRKTLEQLEGDLKNDEELNQIMKELAIPGLISPIKNRLKMLANQKNE